MDTDLTTLGNAFTPLSEANKGKSGILPLRLAKDAFAARMILADTAERSLDIQYYIWHQDTTGTLLFDSLRAAADRGVRVRLLLDDFNTMGMDPILKNLDDHQNIEIRLFNPFLIRSHRWVGGLTDFQRLNRRMHNKSFTADNQVTIIGGRNVGDEYFGFGTDLLFADLDVLAVGTLVKDVSRDFDRYWISDSSYPVKLILKNIKAEVDVAAAAKKIRGQDDTRFFLDAVRSFNVVEELKQKRLDLEWASTYMISDDPAKGLGKAASKGSLLQRLKNEMGPAERRMDIVSPYFVPTEQGVEAFSKLRAKGIKIRVLTNALEATDAGVVHAGYAKYRKSLLRLSVELFEFRNPMTRHKTKDFGKGSSQTSLHAKTIAIDGNRVFIGSFNFDPRSNDLNTELGFIIESSTLAQQIQAVFDHRAGQQAYEVRLAPDNKLYWIGLRDGNDVKHKQEPGTSYWQRLGIKVLGWLPIEWLL
ncbi:MAG: phospholipase D family protein [Chitinophagaceae bacterium]|nr:phospholipase D family protein [Oligoflexus sp.]